MNFWNDYEGKIIAGNYPLQRLLYPEGRSGFFATSNGTGTPAVLRLTETLNDQEEIFEQWDKVRALAHPHLIAIRSYGPTVVDDTPLIYALLEPPDITLAEVLADRAMTNEETGEIASSLVPALRAIHAASMFHGHIEPGNVFAVGETIKLRSDCVRRLPEGPEAAALIDQDVKDLSTLLLAALTRQLNVDQLDGLAPSVSAPLAAIIRNGFNGTWTLQDIFTALQPVPETTKPDADAIEPAPSIRSVEPEAPNDLPDQQLLFEEQWIAEEEADTEVAPSRIPGKLPKATLLYAAVAAALVLGTMLWYGLNPMTAEQWAIAYPSAKPGSVPNISSTAGAASVGAKPNVVSTGSAPAATTITADQPAIKADNNAGGAQWRVVAFTYNREDEARKKVASLERKHHSLHPGLFTPTGGAPYLVTLGGALGRDQAMALKKKARSNGMPRDTYAQNYPGR